MSDESARQSSLVGQTIHGYEFRERIGTGGMSIVYRAYHPALKRDVAVKVIAPEQANRGVARRLEAEAELLARLEHRNIVPVYDYWDEGGAFYLVMRLIPGGTLAEVIKQGPLSPDQILSWLEPIADALTTVHKIGAIHRNLAPSNIRLGKDGTAYLQGFGFTFNHGDPRTFDEEGWVVGTPAYMAPEQWSAEPAPQSDIYGLGVTLYECLVGHSPFAADTPNETMFKHLDKPLPNLLDARPDLPEALNAVLQKATAKDPTQRYPDPMSLAAAFREALAPGDTTYPISVGSTGGIPRQLGRYTVMESIGRGGMGEVFKGRHTTLGKIVAIKVLPSALTNEAEQRKRFEREGRAMAGLKHPNIIEVFDFSEVNGIPYLVMEYIQGQTLRDFMRAHGPLSLSQALPIIQEVASALDYAHQRGLVHRDISAANVMLEPISTSADGRTQRAVLMDFGLAKIIGGSAELSKDGIMGTFDYIAPEQILNSAKVDKRADVYAFGVLTYRMLTGEMPFKGDHSGALINAHLYQPPSDPRAIVADLPESCALALLRSLAKKPEERFATSGELVAALIGH